MTDPNSHTITYSYDADDEETGETWVNPMGGSALNLVTITYDADGDVTQVQDANTDYQYTYIADDEVSTVADNGTTGLPLVTLTYGYLCSGQPQLADFFQISGRRVAPSVGHSRLKAA